MLRIMAMLSKGLEMGGICLAIELHHGRSATNGATPCRFDTDVITFLTINVTLYGPTSWQRRFKKTPKQITQVCTM